MPTYADSFTLAQSHLAAGRAGAAAATLRELLRCSPGHGPALHLLGLLARQAGDAAGARDHFRAAVQAQPASADYRSCLGVAHQELGQLEDAAACHRDALRLDPANALAVTNLAITLMALGRTEEATAYFAEARRRDPRDAGAACNLAAARRAAGATDEALALFREALRLDPNLAQAHNNLGSLLEAQGQHAEAEACYQQALRLAPRLTEAFANLGRLWERAGRVEPAVRLYRQGVQLNPHAWELHARLGEALLTCNRAREALDSCRQALALRPDEPQAHNDLGNAYTALGLLDEAVAAYEQARRLRPDWSVPHYNRGVALQSQGRLAEAQASFREALRLNPTDVVAHSTYVGSLHYDPCLDGAKLLAEHQFWAERHACNIPSAPHANDRDPDRRLRLGYVSPDFRNHAVAFFLEPILAHHDPAQFETFAYAEVPAPDETTARLRDRVHHWRDTHGLSDDELAGAIRADGIDLLVDLAGHLAHNRLLAFARKPAPVQISYLGYPGTTGLPAISYRIADMVTDPPDERSFHSEELVRLAPPFCCYTPPPPLPLAEAPPCDRQGFVTFGSLHKLEKLNDEVLDLWCSILRHLPDSRLLLCRNTLHGSTAEELVKRFGRRGVGAERLVLKRIQAVSMAHLEIYNAIDVALDTFPWCGHTTACEALWMGVPVVTLRGQRCAGRMTASVLQALGLQDLVAETPAAYRYLTVALAQDTGRLVEMRRDLRERMLASPLCDGPGFVRKLEAVYRDLWRRWCLQAPAEPDFRPGSRDATGARRQKPEGCYAGCNEALLRAVPPSARRILEVGCGEGRLGAALKAQDPARRVLGLEGEPSVAQRAARRLDQVFTLDPERKDPPLPLGSLDCILYGDVLEHLADAAAVLRRHRRLLGPGGIVLCSVPNVQHHSVLTALLTSDFQYTNAGLLDATHLRFFTYSTFIKLLLDCGFAPEIVDWVAAPCPSPLFEAAGPLLRHLGLHPDRTARYLGAYQYVFKGTLLPYAADNPVGNGDATTEMPLTFVACVSDEATLRANLLASPCLGPGSPHEVLLYRGCKSAAEGLNRGLAYARHSVVVCVHQDVYLPAFWPSRFVQQYREAERLYGPIGVLGVYGIAGTDEQARQVGRTGRVVDRDRLLWEPRALPASVDTLDELLLAVPKGAPMTFEPRLGFHFYGADACLVAKQGGLQSVAVDAPCFHHSRNVNLPEAFFASAATFAAKWRAALPIATTCVRIDAEGRLDLG